MIDKIKEWITINHQHVPIKEGESKKQAINNAINKYKKQKKSNYKTDVVNKDKQETSKEHLQRGKKEIPKVRKVVEKHYEEELEKLKNHIRDNYDNPEDYLKDMKIERQKLLEGTRREKYDKGEGSKYFSIQREAEEEHRQRVIKIVNELKKENAENDKIIAEYLRKKQSNNKTKKNDEEYSLYKRAKERPESIDPMTENSTDWESLEKKYAKRYENENKKYRTAKDMDMEENEHTKLIKEAKQFEKDKKQRAEQKAKEEELYNKDIEIIERYLKRKGK